MPDVDPQQPTAGSRRRKSRVNGALTPESDSPLTDAEVAKSLTERQKQILQLLCEGLGHKQIAGQLGITIKTVEFHKQRIYQRSGGKSLAQILRLAIRIGLVEP